MEVPGNDLKHVTTVATTNMLRKKYHIDQIGNDWYQLRFLGSQYLDLPLLYVA